MNEGVPCRPAAHPASHAALCFGVLVRGLHRPHNRIQKMAFGQRALQRLLGVDHRLGHGLNAVLIDEVREFGGFNAIGRDEFTFHCKLVGQADRPRTVWSSRRHKNFKVNRLVQLGELFLALRAQARLAF